MSTPSHAAYAKTFQQYGFSSKATSSRPTTCVSTISIKTRKTHTTHLEPALNTNTVTIMDDSPLGKLPAELRNIIYELVLVAQAPIDLDHEYHADKLVASDASTKHAWDCCRPAVRSVRRACLFSGVPTLSVYFTRPRGTFVKNVYLPKTGSTALESPQP